MNEHRAKTCNLFRLILDLMLCKFYGTFTITFKDGDIKHCKKEQSIKL